MLNRLGRLLGLVCLLVGLWGCGQAQTGVPQAVIEQAIALRMAHLQQTLIAHLRPTTAQTPSFKLRRVTVTERQLAPEVNPQTYRITGTYEAAIDLPSRTATESGPFEIYIQLDPSEKDAGSAQSWSLLELGALEWQRIPL